MTVLVDTSAWIALLARDDQYLRCPQTKKREVKAGKPPTRAFERKRCYQCISAAAPPDTPASDRPPVRSKYAPGG